MSNAEIVGYVFLAVMAGILVFAFIMGHQYERQRKEASGS